MDSSHSVEVPLLEQETNLQNTLTFIDSEYYRAAAIGNNNPFNRRREPLNLLLSPTKNTILHIHITQQPKGANVSVSFTEEIIAKCPSLLLQTNNRGETPLHMASRYGHDAIVRFLIDSAKASHQDIEAGDGAAKAMLRMENVDKETALHEAVRHNNPTVVQILTEEDPDFAHSGNQLGETPLYLAVERGYNNIGTRILDTCSSPAFDGPNGRTALHEAIVTEMTMKIIGAKKTLAKKADQQGWTPLHHASHFGRLSIVKQLLECDKSVAYIVDKNGMIPLHLAATRGEFCEEVIFLILDHCPDCLEVVDDKGRNVLHCAIQSMSESLVTNMLKGSSNKGYYVPLLANLINQKDADGNTPLHFLATYCVDNSTLIEHPLVDKMAINNDNFSPLDVVMKSTDNHHAGFRAFTLDSMKDDGGYMKSIRNAIRLRDTSLKVIDKAVLERTKTSHIITTALVATVTFTAGFTMPGGYDSSKGTAILSRNRAFVIFVITDSLALFLSTCALFFYYNLEFKLTARRKLKLLYSAALLTKVSIYLMLTAFASAVFAVLHNSPTFRVIICVITGLCTLIGFFSSKSDHIS